MTTTTQPSKRQPTPGAPWKRRFWAILCETATGPKWRAYCQRSAGAAREAAEKRADVLRTLDARELDEPQFEKLFASSDQHKPFYSAAPKLNRK